MVELTEKPFPPGRYPLVIVGSGPGGLQLSYSLRQLGVDHAVISQDPGPGGMFRRWPVFQRMLSWTKPYAPVDRKTREYERFDWNSLIPDVDDQRGLMVELMDGSSYFPSRPEMERGLCAFAERCQVRVRYECRWESTRIEERDGEREFVLETNEGEFRTTVAVFAVGVAQPWRPPTPGMEAAAPYGEFRPVESYSARRIFIVGKQNSGFEIATGLLPWARQIILASPSPTRLSVNTRSLVGVRARYVQPYEDSALAGGVVVLDTSIERVEKRDTVFVVHTRRADGIEMVFEVDDVIAATGFTAPLQDLPKSGVATFGQSRLPAQTEYWESATSPGIFFAGTLTQAAHGLRKHGIPSNSGAVQGYRYNARVLARHLAETRFNQQIHRELVNPAELAKRLLKAASWSPELWHQRSYLAQVFSVGAEIRDEGTVPLTAFLDSGPPNGVAVTLESNGVSDPYPAIYLRRSDAVSEHLLEPNVMLDFLGPGYLKEVDSLLSELLRPALQAASR